MSAGKQVWRFTWIGLIVSAGLTIVWGAVAIIWLVDPSSAVWLRLLAVFPAGIAFISWRFARSKVALTAESVLIRNPFDVHHILLSQVTSVTNLPGGSIHVTTVGGERIEVFAVHTPTIAWILGRRSRANRMMEAIEDAALACDAPIPPELLRCARGASASPRSQQTGHRPSAS